MNKAFIFDWSGTLSDNFHLFCKVCNNIFKELGKEPLSEKEIRLNFTLPYMKFWNKYFPNMTQDEEKKLFEKYMTQLPKPELYKNSKEIISKLYSEGFKIFILSSDLLSTLLPELNKSGLLNMITEVIGDVHEKEHALIALSDKYELDKKNSFYVGDTSGDIEAGRSAGFKTIGVSWGFQDESILKKSNPDILIDNIIMIKEHL